MILFFIESSADHGEIFQEIPEMVARANSKDAIAEDVSEIE